MRWMSLFMVYIMVSLRSSFPSSTTGAARAIRICNFFDETHYTTGLYKKQAFMHVFLHIYAVPLIL